jgi:hypothetical protein
MKMSQRLPPDHVSSYAAAQNGWHGRVPGKSVPWKRKGFTGTTAIMGKQCALVKAITPFPSENSGS